MLSLVKVGGSVLSRGGVLSSAGELLSLAGNDIMTPPPPCEQNESQTLVKILPCIQTSFAGGTKKIKCGLT